MLPERLCKNKNKEVLKCKKVENKIQTKGGLTNVKANKKTIIAPLIRNRKRCRKTRK